MTIEELVAELLRRVTELEKQAKECPGKHAHYAHGGSGQMTNTNERRTT